MPPCREGPPGPVTQAALAPGPGGSSVSWLWDGEEEETPWEHISDPHPGFDNSAELIIYEEALGARPEARTPEQPPLCDGAESWL